MQKALGRGLEALLSSTKSIASPSDSSVSQVAIAKIKPNRYQPRTQFDESKLEELASSIRIHGVAQPLLISPSSVPGEYELIAGERRWRAAQKAGLQQVPCVVRPVSDRERYELALIENLQREDLNPLEEAKGLKKLMQEFQLTQEELAHALGRSRPGVANKLRLLELDLEVQNAIEAGLISEGHARTLVALTNHKEQKELADRIAIEKLTVREVEKIIADWKSVIKSDGNKKIKSKKSADVRALEEDLQKHFGRKIEILLKGKKGHLKIDFYSFDDLQVLLKQLKFRQK
jgi:ParB family chromosome partitioning protein